MNPWAFLFMPKRAGFYIDGFNFYHAVHDLRDPSLKWMCYRSLAAALKNRDEEVTLVKFFSALASHLPHSRRRHQAFNKALQARGVEVILGQFKEQRKSCKTCQTSYVRHEEKESDVNIAIHLLDDCYRGLIDVAYLVTTDSDLAPAARLIAKRFPNIELVSVATPGRRHSKELVTICGRTATTTQALVRACALPAKVIDQEGNVIVTRPAAYDPL